jgi:hypothetical protein
MLNVSILPTTDDTLEKWSFSRINDYNTCEVWGHVRGAFRKTYPAHGRSMALEAGSAAHEAFAAIRLYRLLEDGLTDHFEYHTRRVYGQEKGQSLIQKVRRGSDRFLNISAFAMDALNASGFYDDPYDKRRTMHNLEESIYAYIKATYGRQNPVYVQDVDKPDSFVGVELPFDFTLEMEYNGEVVFIRYVGTIDGVHISKAGNPYIEENKTSSRLGDPWAASFETSHQVTGYTVFGSKLLGVPINEALIHGVSLPQPRKATSYTEGTRTEHVSRTSDQVEKFFQWVYQTHKRRLEIGDDIERAVQNTGSCNRYFQACSLIPFCKGGADDRSEALEVEMVEIEQSPSEMATTDKTGE